MEKLMANVPEMRALILEDNADLRWIDDAWAPMILKYCNLSINTSHTFANNKENLK